MNEPSVVELLAQHQSNIEPILDRIKGIDHGGTCLVDELFVLRFILSDKNTAEDNIVKTLEWRRANRDAIIAARLGELPYEKEVTRHVKRGACGWISDRYLLLVIRAGHGNAQGLMRDLTQSQCVENFVLHSEQMFMMLDEKTRQTGRLCRLLVALDLQGFIMRRFDRRFFKANGESSHRTALMYPMLYYSLVFINLPATFRIIYSLAKRFTSRTVLERQKICPARTTHRSASECPFLTQFGPSGPAAVPHFLGGTFPLPASLRVDEDEMEEE